MFLTSELSRIKNPLYERGEHGWTQVELILCIPWYLCSFTDYIEGKLFRTSLLLSSINQVIDLSDKKHIKIDEIYLISPGSPNRTKSWEMGKISKILLSTENLENNSYPVYKIVKEDESEVIIDQCFEVKAGDYKFKNLLSFN